MKTLPALCLEDVCNYPFSRAPSFLMDCGSAFALSPKAARLLDQSAPLFCPPNKLAYVVLFRTSERELMLDPFGHSAKQRENAERRARDLRNRPGINWASAVMVFPNRGDDNETPRPTLRDIEAEFFPPWAEATA